ncbi:hypothetical protein IQ243_27215 [Nostocales cyanobacterium LEGE 11386]|nr:hypothetical protein [Nostocales cyanobacterium LEGE 11386]
MKLIKKSEKLTLKKMKEMEEAEDRLLHADAINLSQPFLEEQPVITPDSVDTDSISLNYPIVQSVGNSGWQVSDIWRDLRIDKFCGD